jgi:hypothetical protein
VIAGERGTHHPRHSTGLHPFGRLVHQSTPGSAVVDARIVAQVQFDEGRVEQWDSGGVYEAITVPADEHAMIAVLSAFVREKVKDDVLYDMKMANISVVGQPSGAPIAWDLSGV